MKISILFLIILNYIKANNDRNAFLTYNGEILKHYPYKHCQNPKYYIETANIEETKPENQDKIILYHGESYGVWLFQLILKAFKYPEAEEDWLPLRYKQLEKDIDRTDLMRLINDRHEDDSPQYSELGLSVSPNLVSIYNAESAWWFICKRTDYKWHKIAGLSDDESLHSSMYDMIKKEFIPEVYWDRFKRQKKILYKFIQIKRCQRPYYNVMMLYREIRTLYPNTFKHYKKHFYSMPYYCTENFDEGVALQIIMDRDSADSLTYSSKTYGWVESKKHEKFKNRIPWYGEDIEPYSEFYKETKNKQDMTQARLALNNDFRSFPSRVKIKSIAGIMEDPVDYEILKSMIKEMTNFSNIESQSYLPWFTSFFRKS